MKAGIIFAVVIILIFGAAGYWFLERTPKSPQPPTAQNKVEIKDSQSADSDLTTGLDSSAQSGSYQEYSKSAFDNTPDKKRVLFFYASWCPTCRPANSDFQQNTNKIPANVAIFRVNYNDPETDEVEKDLAKEYGITYQHTYVLIDETGKEIKKWNGGALDKLISEVQ